MKIVTFAREYEQQLDPINRRVFPAGWRGAVDDKTAAAAKKAGVLEAAPEKPRTAKQKAAASRDLLDSKASNSGSDESDTGSDESDTGALSA